MSITKLLNSDAFISTNKLLIKAFKSTEAAVYFCNLCAKHDYWESRNGLEDGFFYCTQEYIQEELFISPKVQLKYCRMFEKMGIITTKVKGLPKKKYFRINGERVLQVLEIAGKLPKGDTVVSHREIIEYPSGTINKIKETRLKKQDKENYTDDLRPSESLWVNELPESEFPFCIEAMKEIDALKNIAGYENLYDGPLPYKEWVIAEKRLSVAEFELGELRDRIYDIYKNRYQHSKKHQAANSINLCYLVHGYDDTDDGTRLLHIIQEGKDEDDIF